ncbi:MAG: ATP-binding protein [Nitriliruptoraceae bacterium]
MLRRGRRGVDRPFDVALRRMADVSGDATTADGVLERVLDVLGEPWGLHGIVAFGSSHRSRPNVLARAGTIEGNGRTTPVAVGAAVVEQLVVDGELTATRARVLEAVGWVLDAQFGRLRVEHALHERVKELSALREVQIALESVDDPSERFQRIVDAVAAGMQFPDVARAELTLDDRSAVGGASGTFATRLGADIIAGGVARGDLQVGYVEPRSFLEPEERNLVYAIARSIGMHVDLTAAREDAQAAADRLQRVLETLPSAVFAVDHDLSLEFISAADAFPVTLRPGDVTTMNAWDDPLRARAIGLVRTALDGQHVRDEFEWFDKWWDVRVEPLFRPDGSVERALAMMLDVTDQHVRAQTQQALAASQAQFEIIARAISDVVYRLALQPEPHLDYVSPSATSVLGFEPQALLADPDLVARRSHPEDRPRISAFLTAPRVGDGSLRWRWQRADGEWIWLDDHRSLLEQDGEPVAIVGVVRDVTAEVHESQRTRRALEQERQIAEQLRRVDDMKSTFLSAVSHELRTPLTSVLGFTETARRMARNGDDVTGVLERALDNAKRLHRLIDDLLDVDRLTRGAITPRRSPTDLRALITRVLAREGAVGAPLEMDLEPVSLEVDSGMIERVIDNLVRNVRRHTPAGTHAWVRLRQTSTGGARIVVEDDGPGIDAELREQIFEPFEQGASANRSPTPGTGIGLALVERFVEVNGGTVALDERPGGGARFTITLPPTG